MKYLRRRNDDGKVYLYLSMDQVKRTSSVYGMELESDMVSIKKETITVEQKHTPNKNISMPHDVTYNTKNTTNENNNLEKVNYKVDYIISHCCPTSIQTLINPTYKFDIFFHYFHFQFH